LDLFSAPNVIYFTIIEKVVHKKGNIINALSSINQILDCLWGDRIRSWV